MSTSTTPTTTTDVDPKVHFFRRKGVRKCIKTSKDFDEWKTSDSRVRLSQYLHDLTETLSTKTTTTTTSATTTTTDADGKANDKPSEAVQGLLGILEDHAKLIADTPPLPMKVGIVQTLDAMLRWLFFNKFWSLVRSYFVLFVLFFTDPIRQPGIPRFPQEARS